MASVSMNSARDNSSKAVVSNSSKDLEEEETSRTSSVNSLVAAQAELNSILEVAALISRDSSNKNLKR